MKNNFDTLQIRCNPHAIEFFKIKNEIYKYHQRLWNEPILTSIPVNIIATNNHRVANFKLLKNHRVKTNRTKTFNQFKSSL